jgi:GT2 family glycosyltransferase
VIETPQRQTEAPAKGPATNEPLVGIVILNWNRSDDTIACVASLRRMAYQNYRVVVVDNGSRDDSVVKIRAAYPDLDLIENGRNLGFAGGNNVGIERLMAAGCDYVMLLNDDAEVAEDTLTKLVEVAETDPAIGFVGPTICYYGQPRVIWFAGGRITPYGEPSHPGDGAELGEPGQPPRDVDYVTGCAILARRDLIETIGPLDPRFFLYFEETEWCTRGRQHGYRVVYVPDAVMWHKITPTARIHSHRYLYMMTRNRLLYLHLTGAGLTAKLAAAIDSLRTVLSWAMKPRHRDMRPYTFTPLRGMAAYALGRYGEPPANL